MKFQRVEEEQPTLDQKRRDHAMIWAYETAKYEGVLNYTTIMHRANEILKFLEGMPLTGPGGVQSVANGDGTHAVDLSVAAVGRELGQQPYQPSAQYFSAPLKGRV